MRGVLLASAAASMVPMASDVKLGLSMRIVRHGDRAKVAVAAEGSVVAAMPCAVGWVSGRAQSARPISAPPVNGPAECRRRLPGGRAAARDLNVARDRLRAIGIVLASS